MIKLNIKNKSIKESTTYLQGLYFIFLSSILLNYIDEEIILKGLVKNVDIFDDDSLAISKHHF